MCSQAEITCCHSTIQSIWAPGQCHQTAYSLAVPVGQVPQPPSHIPTWVSYCNRTLWWWCHRCLVATSVLPAPWSMCELWSQACPDGEETSTQLMPRRSFVSPTSPPLKILVAQRQACKCPSPGPQHQVSRVSQLSFHSDFSLCRQIPCCMLSSWHTQSWPCGFMAQWTPHLASKGHPRHVWVKAPWPSRSWTCEGHPSQDTT